LPQAEAALAAGVQFALAPGTSPMIIKRFQEAGVPFMPGVATPSDIERALSLGCRRQKFFPAGTLGGVSALKAMSAPYAHLGIEFCPTGGVNLDNLQEYLSLPQVFTVGGTWLATREDIEQQHWEAITAKAAAAVKAAA
ncbi:MAG: keto-deoxy-phosphogluconate aldolase, partial [Planctomycetales bacterium]|nr:keto-deoxy-phosphogluconate aldolase [Planctomycetales bacterium]